MPVLKNAKYEKFAQAIAKGMNATEATKEAGYADPRNSTRLTKKDEIRRRIDELNERAAEKAEWTAADRLKMLSDIASKTLGEDPRVAVSAIAEANKMQGSHAASKHQHSGPGGGPIPTIDVNKLKGMSDKELELLERALVQIGIVDGDTGRESQPEN